jgi:BlaI family transcriptional regulator, penicillinase repressor
MNTLLPTSAEMEKRAPRHSVLGLSPLELECMNRLWPMQRGTVRQIRDRLAEKMPRAYTTIMTIMDRLARKGIVTRQKVGRAYVYEASLTEKEARAHAVEQIIDGFFGGSRDALAKHLGESRPQAAASDGVKRPDKPAGRQALR